MHVSRVTARGFACISEEEDTCMCQESLLGALHASCHPPHAPRVEGRFAIWCLSGFRAWVVGYAERGASTREGRIYWVFVEQ